MSDFSVTQYQSNIYNAVLPIVPVLFRICTFYSRYFSAVMLVLLSTK